MKFIKFETIDSTNTWALAHFDELDDLTIVLTSSQTAGRGRFDRVWVSENYQNIYASFVLKPHKLDNIVNLTQYLSVVVAKVLESYDVTPEIKWPNDVLINGKKICGILCEVKRQKNVINGVVLGIGVNLNMPQSVILSIDRPATSLNLVLNKEIDRDKFLNCIVSEFFRNYTSVLENGFVEFRKEYLKYVRFIGKNIKIQQRDGDKLEEFVAERIDECGNLIVTDGQNHKIIYSGDLIL